MLIAWLGASIGGLAIARCDEPLAEFDVCFRDERVAYFTVPVTIRGARYRFVVDTGASYTSVDSTLRSLLRLRPGRIRSSSVGGKASLPVYEMPPASVGAVRLPPLDNVICCDIAAKAGDSLPAGIDGMLGMDALHGSILQINCDRGTLSFLSVVPDGVGERVSLESGQKVPVIVGILDKAGGRQFIVDTGFDGQAAITHSDFEFLFKERRLTLAANRPARTSTGQRSVRVGVLDGEVSVGRYSHAAVVAVELPSGGLSNNLLGLDYLSRYIVTFDFPRNCVYFKPSDEFRTLRPMSSLGGVRLERAGQAVRILSVRGKNSITQVLRSDDVLKTINGNAVATMSDSEIVRCLMGDGGDLRLDFHRPGDGTAPWLRIRAAPSASR